MEKKTFITLIMSVIGGMLFSLGMCMIMAFEGLMIPGIAVGIVGIIMLLCLIPMCVGFKDSSK